MDLTHEAEDRADDTSSDGPDLTAPELYLNRELSVVAFNQRVLAQAEDASLPLLQRLRFLTIFSSNVDEFFEVRVAGLQEGVALDAPSPGPDGLGAEEVLERLHEQLHASIDRQYQVLNQDLLPALAAEGIKLLKRTEWGEAVDAWVRDYFQDQVLPVLTPVGLDPAHPFPQVLNKGLNFVVSVDGQDAFERDISIAIVRVPRCLPRLIRVPRDISGHRHHFVMLSSVIHARIESLFHGMDVQGAWQFRLTRNSDLWLDPEEVDDLRAALSMELPRRHYGKAVRLEVASNCPDQVAHFLVRQFDLRPADLYQVDGPVNLARLSALCDLVDRPDLKVRPFVPGRSQEAGDVFALIRERDVLLHHPYQSFVPVLELLRQAARDPAVLAIKQTLYRTGTGSPVVKALIEAARNGKAVTACVELRARFDEAANLDLADRLSAAGANVVYGIVGVKTHAKMLLIVRREGGELRRYVHLGTGNYHATTARLYTDFSLLTCAKSIGADVHAVFQQLTGPGAAPPLRVLAQSPFTLKPLMLARIAAEAEAARRGEPSAIRAKLNALIDPGIIQALYDASRAGVPIDLLVRGACRLRPGIPGISETIRVRAIVGRFLEHSRVFHFHAGGEDEVWCSSADWMERNLHRRVEVAFPVLDPTLRARVLREALDLGLADEAGAWSLRPDGSYAPPPGVAESSSQSRLLDELAGRPGN